MSGQEYREKNTDTQNEASVLSRGISWGEGEGKKQSSLVIRVHILSHPSLKK